MHLLARILCVTGNSTGKADLSKTNSQNGIPDYYTIPEPEVSESQAMPTDRTAANEDVFDDYSALAERPASVQLHVPVVYSSLVPPMRVAEAPGIYINIANE